MVFILEKSCKILPKSLEFNQLTISSAVHCPSPVDNLLKTYIFRLICG